MGCKEGPTGNEGPQNPSQTNSAPTASASASETAVTVGTEVTVDASGSSDPDNDALSYTWTLSVPSGSNAQLSDTDIAAPVFTPETDGEYTATVTVSDGNGGSSDASVTITADPASCTKTEISSNITSDRILENNCTDPAKVDYLVTAGIDVTAALTIKPGVVISFAAGTDMDVMSGGTLNAVGKADSSIVFTGEQQSPGYWYGLVIRTNSPDNVLDHVEVRYGGSDYGNVMVGYYSDDAARLNITNSTLSHSGTNGLYMEDSGQFTGFSGNTFSNNTGAPLYLPAKAIHALDGASTYADGNGQDNRVEVYAQKVSANVTWSDLKDTAYLLNGITDINGDVTVEAGAEFVFAGSAGIDVNTGGTFSAIGTSDSRILFTGEQQSPGYWYGITIRTNSTKNALQYVDVRYGGSEYGNVVVGHYDNDSARLKITNSILSHSGTYGLYMESSALFTGFSNNTFSNNTGSPLYLPAKAIHALDGASNYEDGNGGDNRVEVYAQEVTQDVTWHDLSDDSDGDGVEAAYLFGGSTKILGALTIEEGATLLFKEQASIYMQEGGTMTAVGTSTERIEFAGKEQDKTQGYWFGLVFRTNSSDNLLDNVLVHNAGSDYGNVMVGYYSDDNTLLTIRDSQIGYSGSYGIWVETSATYTGSGNTFSNNLSGDIHYD